MYKPGSFLIGDDNLMIFVSDKTLLSFRGLSKACIKSLMTAKVDYHQYAVEGGVEVNLVNPVEVPPPPPAE